MGRLTAAEEKYVLGAGRYETEGRTCNIVVIPVPETQWIQCFETRMAQTCALSGVCQAASLVCTR